MKINHISLDENVREEIHPMKTDHISLDDNLLRSDSDFCLSESLLRMKICFRKDGTKENNGFVIYFLSFHLCSICILK